MNKQIIILLLFSVQLSAQSKDPNPHFPKQKISVSCNQDFLDNYKGKWLIPNKTLFNAPNSKYSQGAMERVNQVHELVIQVYPQPMGSDGYWMGAYRKTDFGQKIKYVTENGRTQMEYVTQNQVEGWGYGMGLSAWMCSEVANEMWNGYPDAGGGNGITVEANNLQILNGEFMDDDGWTIDGQAIKRKMPVIGKWKGYDRVAVNGGDLANLNSISYILITRDGMLPYIPVTKKQYLDLAIAYAGKFYDKALASAEQIPDKTERDETKKKYSKLKNDALKKLQDELQKTTNDGSLDAPAVVGADPLGMSEGPIFLTESKGGIMLTIEDPKYFRNDLPAYVPQFFVVSWISGKCKWCSDFRQSIENNFPVEKLKAMIDK